MKSEIISKVLYICINTKFDYRICILFCRFKELFLVYLFIILLVAIAFLILERQRFFGESKKTDSNKSFFGEGIWSGNFFKRKEFEDSSNNSTHLIQCDKCGTYIDKNEAINENGKMYCKECQKLPK